MRRHAGQMLIVVLWAMGLVSIAVGTVTVRSTHEVRLGRIPLELVERRALAQAGLAQATRLVQQDTQESPDVDTLQEGWASGRDVSGAPLVEGMPIGDGTVTVGQTQDGHVQAGLIDEERKLNVNTASIEAVAQLIALLNAQSEAPLTDTPPHDVAAALADWIDGPEDDPACDAIAYPCHNAPLDTVDELRVLPGMSPALFQALRPYVTVYGIGTVNVNTAPAIVLDAMGCPGETLVQQRDQQPFTSPPTDCSGLGVTSSAFTVPVEVRLDGRSDVTRLSAVITRAGNILAWSPAISLSD